MTSEKIAKTSLVEGLARSIDSYLPQTQCTQCGYPRCHDYAAAVASGVADINQCPPGGDKTIDALARLLQTAPKPLNARHGTHQPRAQAIIDETLCIGCRKCVDACPVDAIVGARKLMHTVIASECTGCELCLPPCPVDCIALVPASNAAGDFWPEYTRSETDLWRARAVKHVMRRQERLAAKREAHTRARARHRDRIKNEIKAAVQRAKARRAQLGGVKPAP